MQPPGETRNYSAPRKYQIDASAGNATEIWHYYPDPSVYSPFCSSVYEDAPNNYLIDYTQAGPYIYTGIVGLDSSGNVAFNYQYDLLGFCGTAWNIGRTSIWSNALLRSPAGGGPLAASRTFFSPK